MNFYDLSLGAPADRQADIEISDPAGGYAGSAAMGIAVLLSIVGLFFLVVALWRAGFVPLWSPGVFLTGAVAPFVLAPGALSFTIVTAAWLLVLGHVGPKMLGMSDEEWERGEAPASGGAGPVVESPVA